MLNFGKFLHSETSAIGLTSLGLSKKLENKTASNATISPQTQVVKQSPQNLNSYSISQKTLGTSSLKNNEETLNSLFGRNTVLNLNSGKLIG